MFVPGQTCRRVLASASTRNLIFQLLHTHSSDVHRTRRASVEGAGSTGRSCCDSPGRVIPFTPGHTGRHKKLQRVYPGARDAFPGYRGCPERLGPSGGPPGSENNAGRTLARFGVLFTPSSAYSQ
eukprot:5575509-Prymnesium_polylepis.2